MTKNPMIYGVASNPVLNGWIFDMRHMVTDRNHSAGWEDAERVNNLTETETSQRLRAYAAQALRSCTPN